MIVYIHTYILNIQWDSDLNGIIDMSPYTVVKQGLLNTYDVQYIMLSIQNTTKVEEAKYIIYTHMHFVSKKPTKT